MMTHFTFKHLVFLGDLVQQRQDQKECLNGNSDQETIS